MHIHDNNNRGHVRYRVGLSFELAFDTVIVEDVMHSGIYRPNYKKHYVLIIRNDTVSQPIKQGGGGSVSTAVGCSHVTV